jgi:uncharacterized protein
MTATTYQLWTKRGDALIETIDHHLTAIQAGQEPVNRQGTITALLTALKAFGKSQLDFFVNGFDPDAKIVRLEPSTVYPPEYAMRATVDQIAYDLDVIQRAYQQRLPAQSTAAMRTTLAKADYLAYCALKPAIANGLIEDVTVVTYFQKAVNVRIIPYAPVAFIGLPLSALTVPRDLLAIPHEVGHYVFRHGRTTKGFAAGSRFDAALAHQLADLPAWCLAWLEEIFADVYGAVIGGPVMALGFEDLVTDDPFADFTKDDGEHPIAALRPDIYHSVFQKQGSNGFEVELLTERWSKWLKARGNPDAFTPHNDKEPIALDEAKKVVNKAIKAMLAGDLGDLNADTRLWSSALRAGARAEQLLHAFEQRIHDLAVAEDKLAPELAVLPQAGTRGVATDPTAELELHLRPLKGSAESGVVPSYDLGGPSGGSAGPKRRVGDTGLWIDALKNNGATFNIPPAVWMALLDGSGWAVEGPGGGNAH